MIYRVSILVSNQFECVGRVFKYKTSITKVVLYEISYLNV